MREECHSNFEVPVPEEKKNICEYDEDVSYLIACGEILTTIRLKNEKRWKRRGQELLHVKENKARNLVLINIKYVEYFEFVKERVSMCTWWRMSNDLKAFFWRRKRGCKWEENVDAQIIEQYWRYGSLVYMSKGFGAFMVNQCAVL